MIFELLLTTVLFRFKIFSISYIIFDFLFCIKCYIYVPTFIKRLGTVAFV